jgi:hypothetical protein
MFGLLQQSHVNISGVFRNLVRHLEKSAGQTISLTEIASDFQLHPRRVYEFFNLFSALEVCSALNRGQLSWVGVHKLFQTIETVYTEMEVASLQESFENLFKLDKSPSLGLIAVRFMSLYLFLGVDHLPIRRVTLFFHNEDSGLKSLERRIYVVVNFLEVIGVVEHTRSVGEYRLLLNRASIVEHAMKERQQICFSASPERIEALLNRCEPQFLHDLYARRRGIFLELTQKAG